MFKLALLKSLMVTWPVELTLEIAGQPVVCQFDAHFRVLSDNAIAELIQQGDSKLIDAVLENWEGVVTADGSPLPCTPENVKLMLSYACVRSALITAYFEAMAGAARKNSKRRQPTG